MKGEKYLERLKMYEEKVPGLTDSLKRHERINVATISQIIGIPKKKLESDLWHIRKDNLLGTSVQQTQRGSTLYEPRTPIFGAVEKDLSKILSYVACEDKETLEWVRFIFLKYSKDLEDMIEKKQQVDD